MSIEWKHLSYEQWRMIIFWWISHFESIPNGEFIIHEICDAQFHSISKKPARWKCRYNKNKRRKNWTKTKQHKKIEEIKIPELEKRRNTMFRFKSRNITKYEKGMRKRSGIIKPARKKLGYVANRYYYLRLPVHKQSCLSIFYHILNCMKYLMIWRQIIETFMSIYIY